MKKWILIIAFFSFIFLMPVCKSSEAPTPPPPATPECEKYHTAEITFENKSTTNTTYDVIWDGSKLTTIAPGTKSQAYTVAAGTHTLLFRITNTYWTACTQSSPVLAQCYTYSYSCSY
jgi:hypothetical protein